MKTSKAPFLKNLEVYRLWDNGNWDTQSVDIELFNEENVSEAESKAVTKAWCLLVGK
jgi:hypothetical protein